MSWKKNLTPCKVKNRVTEWQDKTCYSDSDVKVSNYLKTTTNNYLLLNSPLGANRPKVTINWFMTNNVKKMHFV